MEAFAALSIASNILQVVDTGLRVIRKANEIFTSSHGTTESYERLAVNVKDLDGALFSLRSRTVKHDNDQMSTTISDVDSVYETASRCISTAEKLEQEIAKLTITTKSTSRVRNASAAVWKATKAHFKKDEIDSLAQSLRDCQNIVHTRLLVLLTKDHLDRADDPRTERYRTVLDSFRFPEIHTRQEQIPERHRKTYEWIFGDKMRSTNGVSSDLITSSSHSGSETSATSHDDGRIFDLDNGDANEHTLPSREASPHSNSFDLGELESECDTTERSSYCLKNHGPGTANEQAWDDFVDWLEHGCGIYWIAGKAGSGKSTLMNFIVEDHRTTSYLKTWAGNKKLVTPSFFLWSTGSTLQKSIEGLLRTVIWQILADAPALTHVAFPSAVEIDRIVTDQKHPVGVSWTGKRLRTVLEALLSVETVQYCMFIDGLDELAGPYRQLLDLLVSLSHKSNVKICVSSRPESDIQIRLNSYPGLSLQHLTWRDRQRYVFDRIQNSDGSTESGLLSPSQSSECFVCRVVDRSEGVFIWVRCVMDMILDDVSLGFDVDELQSRLDRIPKEIEDLYYHKLSKLESHYQRSAVEYLSLLVGLQKFDAEMLLIDAVFLNAPNAAIQASRNSSIPCTQLLEDMCKKAVLRVPKICGGLVEINVFDGLVAVGDPLFSHFVLLHRTVADFLSTNTKWQALVKTHISYTEPSSAMRHLLLNSRLHSLSSNLLTHIDKECLLEICVLMVEGAARRNLDFDPLQDVDDMICHLIDSGPEILEYTFPNWLYRYTYPSSSRDRLRSASEIDRLSFYCRFNIGEKYLSTRLTKNPDLLDHVHLLMIWSMLSSQSDNVKTLFKHGATFDVCWKGCPMNKECQHVKFWQLFLVLDDILHEDIEFYTEEAIKCFTKRDQNNSLHLTTSSTFLFDTSVYSAKISESTASIVWRISIPWLLKSKEDIFVYEDGSVKNLGLNFEPIELDGGRTLSLHSDPVDEEVRLTHKERLLSMHPRLVGWTDVSGQTYTSDLPITEIVYETYNKMEHRSFDVSESYVYSLLLNDVGRSFQWDISKLVNRFEVERKSRPEISAKVFIEGLWEVGELQRLLHEVVCRGWHEQANYYGTRVAKSDDCWVCKELAGDQSAFQKWQESNGLEILENNLSREGLQ